LLNIIFSLKKNGRRWKQTVDKEIWSDMINTLRLNNVPFGDHREVDETIGEGADIMYKGYIEVAKISPEVIEIIEHYFKFWDIIPCNDWYVQLNVYHSGLDLNDQEEVKADD
jgi:hypothetical protein